MHVLPPSLEGWRAPYVLNPFRKFKSQCLEGSLILVAGDPYVKSLTELYAWKVTPSSWWLGAIYFEVDGSLYMEGSLVLDLVARVVGPLVLVTG